MFLMWYIVDVSNKYGLDGNNTGSMMIEWSCGLWSWKSKE